MELITLAVGIAIGVVFDEFFRRVGLKAWAWAKNWWATR